MYHREIFRKKTFHRIYNRVALCFYDLSLHGFFMIASVRGRPILIKEVMKLDKHKKLPPRERHAWEVSLEKQHQIEKYYLESCERCEPYFKYLDNFRVAQINNGRFIRMLRFGRIASKQAAQAKINAVVQLNHGINDFVIIPMHSMAGDNIIN